MTRESITHLVDLQTADEARIDELAEAMFEPVSEYSPSRYERARKVGREIGRLNTLKYRGFNVRLWKRTGWIAYAQCAKCGKQYKGNQSMWQLRHFWKCREDK